MSAPATTLRYAWAAPPTLVGLVVATLSAALGARARMQDGVLEVAGGRLAPLASKSGFVAITLGHVVLGLDRRILDRMRVHEHAHVRQYERWGVLFFPAYAAAGTMQLLRGRHPYQDNVFERRAREAARAHVS